MIWIGDLSCGSAPWENATVAVIPIEYLPTHD